MNEFHDVRFPTAVSFGATGGPGRRVEIVALSSGHERRNLRFAHSRRDYDAGTGLRSSADLMEIVAFFEARRGAFHGFRFRDPFDHLSCAAGLSPASGDQWLGTGDGETASFRLMKTYGSGGDAYRRPVTRPVAGSVVVAVNGAAREAGTHLAVDHDTGTVTFLPGQEPAEGQVVTAGFAFDVPARFDTERLGVSLATFRAGQIPSIPIVEIIEP